MDAANWLPLFVTSIIAERGAANNTVAAYTRDLTDFGSFLNRHRKTLADASQTDISDYLIGLGQLSPATRARRLSAIRQLYRFAAEENWIAGDPATRLSGPRKAATCRSPSARHKLTPSSTPPAAWALRRITDSVTPA